MSLAGRVGTPIVDAHHHLWHYNATEYDWLEDRMAMLRRDFTGADLEAAMDSAGVDFSIAVQARQSLEETRALLAVAASRPRVAAVVGWLPLSDPAALERSMREFASSGRLAGLRHVVQGEPEGFLDGREFNEGLRVITEASLAYDLLVRADQLEEATRFVDRHPHQRFVLDHLAKPYIAASLLEPWKTHLGELALRPNVACKLSGMVTEAVWDRWSLETLRPYMDAAVEAFGVDRLLVGSDWPVCLVASGYKQWWTTLRSYFTPFSEDERRACFGGNAISFYGLELASIAGGNEAIGTPVVVSKEH